MLARLDGPRPESITIRAVHGFPVEELVNAGRDADMIVPGSRGAGGLSRLHRSLRHSRISGLA